jgi:hypothetical protein
MVEEELVFYRHCVASVLWKLVLRMELVAFVVQLDAELVLEQLGLGGVLKMALKLVEAMLVFCRHYVASVLWKLVLGMEPVAFVVQLEAELVLEQLGLGGVLKMDLKLVEAMLVFCRHYVASVLWKLVLGMEPVAFVAQLEQPGLGGVLRMALKLVEVRLVFCRRYVASALWKELVAFAGLVLG